MKNLIITLVIAIAGLTLAQEQLNYEQLEQSCVAFRLEYSHYFEICDYEEEADTYIYYTIHCVDILESSNYTHLPQEVAYYKNISSPRSDLIA